MLAPVYHVRALGVEDVAERRVAGIGRTGNHRVFSVDLAREKHAVSVIRQECVFALYEFLEIVCIRNADGRAVVAVAPGNIVLVLNLQYARIIAILSLENLRIIALKFDRLILEFPF